MNRTSFDRRVHVGVFVVLLAVFAYLMWLIIRPFLAYLLAALLLAFLLTPAQRRLAPRVGPRIAALTLVSVAIAATGTVTALIVLSIPATVTDITAALEDLPGEGVLQRRVEEALGIEVPLESMLADLPGRFAELVVGDLTGVLEATTDFFLGIVLFLFVLYYLLQEGDALVDWVRRMLPLDDETTEELVTEAHDTTWAVLKGHVFIAVVQGFVAGVGLFVAGVPYVVFWTLVMIIMGLLPIVGVTVVLGPAVVYLVLVDRLLAALFLFVYGMTVVALVDDYLRAYVVDRQSSLHSASILVGVFGGIYAFGFMGLFFGPIVVGLFQTLVRLFNENVVDGDGGLGTGRPADAPRDEGSVDRASGEPPSGRREGDPSRQG